MAQRGLPVKVKARRCSQLISMATTAEMSQNTLRARLLGALARGINFMYTYVLSTGCYSDYGVNKIVQSKHRLDFAKLKNYQCVYGSEFGIDPEYVNALITLDDHFLHRAYMVINGVDVDNHVKLNEFLRSDKNIKFNFIQWLIDNGIVKEVEYTEINMTEDEIGNFTDV